MGRAKASITVPPRAADAEALWYDPHRWQSWVDGFGHVVSLSDGWPGRGAELVWESPPGGRGRVTERVVAYEMRMGQTLEVEDATMSGRQTVKFEPGSEAVEVTLSLEGEWPRRGAELVWQSPPGGRGRVSERVVAYEMRLGQTVEVEDATMTGRQTVKFEPGTESVEVTLSLEYRIKDRTPLTPVVDVLFVRRAIADALRRTVTRFANERKAEIQFGVGGR